MRTARRYKWYEVLLMIGSIGASGMLCSTLNILTAYLGLVRR